MKTSFLVALIAITLVGCASAPPVVQFSAAAEAPLNYVENKLAPDTYPNYLAGEGNIYSCRFGIHMQSADQFNPSKDKVFSALLLKALPDVRSRKVVLTRFDVYVNNRLGMLRTAGQSIGGFVGAAVADSDKVNANVFTFKKLIVDAAPLNPKARPNEHIVGCDHEHEGEFFASDISGGHAVIVTWLAFQVDEVPYTFKTYYQFQSDHPTAPTMINPATIGSVVNTAVDATFEYAATSVKLK